MKNRNRSPERVHVESVVLLESGSPWNLESKWNQESPWNQKIPRGAFPQRSVFQEERIPKRSVFPEESVPRGKDSLWKEKTISEVRSDSTSLISFRHGMS